MTQLKSLVVPFRKLLDTSLNFKLPWAKEFFLFSERFENAADTIGTLPRCWTLPPMIRFLELRACSVRIKGLLALKWGTCSYSNTKTVEYSASGKTENKCWFQASGTYVRGDTGAGGLVAPLPCTVFGCSLPQQA